VTEIGMYAFADCFGLERIEIGDGVSVIEEKTFWQCHMLSELTLGDGLKTVGNHAFDSCRALTEIVLPAQTEKLGSKAFYGCTSLQTLRYQGSREAWNSMRKTSDWNFGAENVKVVCEDGEISAE